MAKQESSLLPIGEESLDRAPTRSKPKGADSLAQISQFVYTENLLHRSQRLDMEMCQRLLHDRDRAARAAQEVLR